MKLNLKIFLIIISFLFSSGCAFISEIGLLNEADFHNSEFEAPLRIDLQSNIISQQMMVKRDGTLWSMDVNYRNGRNYLPKKYYLGREGRDFYGKVDYLEDVVEVAASGGAITVLKSDGSLWSWGQRSYGTYLKNSGISGHDEERTLKPKRIPNLPSISNIYSTAYGMIAIDISGSVWKWGERKFDFKESEKDINNEINAVMYNLSEREFLNLNKSTPIKMVFPKAISKVAHYGETYLSKDGDIFKLIPSRFLSKMNPYIESKVGAFIYKMKLPAKAVDVVWNTVLLENGRVFELASWSGMIWHENFGEKVYPTRKIEGLARVVKIGRESAITSDGEIFRWGKIYGFGQPVELTQKFYSKRPVYIGDIEEEVTYFSRDLIVYRDGTVYLYGSQTTYSGYLSKYWPDEAGPFFYEGFYLSPIARRKSVKNASRFFKLNEISM